MNHTSREIHLVSYPQGTPVSNNFSVVSVALPEPQAGQVQVQNLFLSVDPYMRGRMRPVKSYVPPFELGRAMDGGAVGTVVASNDPQFAKGDLVLSFMGWREAFVAEAKHLTKIDAHLAHNFSPSVFLGILGMPGLTAWVGLHEIAQLRASDTFFVSGAAGAVGSAAGQLAKLMGCRVIGSAGSLAKVAQLTQEFGFDSAFCYKDGNVTELLQKAAPQGIDVYFDNVGGDHLRAALNSLNVGGRVAVCGAISTYNNEKPAPGPDNLAQIIGKRLLLRGFIVSDHTPKMPQMLKEVSEALAQKKLVAKETIYQGIEKMPQAFVDMLRGENVGKMLVKI